MSDFWFELVFFTLHLLSDVLTFIVFGLFVLLLYAIFVIQTREQMKLEATH